MVEAERDGGGSARTRRGGRAPRAAVRALHRQASSTARQRRDAPWAWRYRGGVGDEPERRAALSAALWAASGTPRSSTVDALAACGRSAAPQ